MGVMEFFYSFGIGISFVLGIMVGCVVCVFLIAMAKKSQAQERADDIARHEQERQLFDTHHIEHHRLMTELNEQLMRIANACGTTRWDTRRVHNVASAAAGKTRRK